MFNKASVTTCIITLALFGCGGGTDSDSVEVTHCSAGNQYYKVIEDQEVRYTFTTNNCNNLETLHEWIGFFYVRQATFSHPEGEFIKCGFKHSGDACSKNESDTQYLTFESADRNTIITYTSMVGASFIEADTRIYDSGVEVGGSYEVIYSGDDNYEYLNEMIFNYASMFDEAIREAQQVPAPI